jgi:hypothetical protein
LWVRCFDMFLACPVLALWWRGINVILCVCNVYSCSLYRQQILPRSWLEVLILFEWLIGLGSCVIMSPAWLADDVTDIDRWWTVFSEQEDALFRLLVSPPGSSGSLN